MLKISYVVFVVLAVGVLTHAMHLHPHSKELKKVQIEDENREISNINGIHIDDIRNIKRTRFVPVNNVLFFKSFSQCDEGYERDFLGICREVW